MISKFPDSQSPSGSFDYGEAGAINWSSNISS